MSFFKSMRHPNSEFLIRRADVRDAAVIARHRARMFHDMGELSEEAFDETVSLLYDTLPAPGYLFIGSTESITSSKAGFDLQQIGGAAVYAKH